jgi:RNA polymerase sigma-70 factor, ECF subfamily
MKSTFGTSSSLLERVRADELGAWEQLCEIYTPLVYSWARRAGLQESDAQDICQETFKSVATHIKRFRRDRPEDSFRGWLWVIHRNHIHQWSRDRFGHAAAEGGSEARARFERIPEPIDQDTSEPEQDPREEAALIRRALRLIENDFAPSTWKAFWRFAIDGLSAKDIAEELGISELSVRQAKYRVLKRLKEVLE